MLQIKWSVNDEYYTPACAVYPIIPYLKPGASIWCPFDREESQYVKVFSENGFTVIHGHVETGQDFFINKLTCEAWQRLMFLCRTATTS